MADVRYRAEQERALGDVKRSLARLAIERAGRLFERGTIAEGMLWLARALENVPPDSPALDRAVRAGLGGWHAGDKLCERTLSHLDMVHAVAFSPDGRRLATACADGTAQLWDVARGSRLSSPMDHPAAVRAVAFGPDGRLAVTVAADGAVRLWDAMTGALATDAGRHGTPGSALCVSPDGRRIAAVAADGTIGVRDAATAGPIGSAIRHEAAVRRWRSAPTAGRCSAPPATAAPGSGMPTTGRSGRNSPTEMPPRSAASRSPRTGGRSRQGAATGRPACGTSRAAVPSASR